MQVVDTALGSPGDLFCDLLDFFGSLGVIADDLVDFLGQKVAGGAFDKLGLLEDAHGSGIFITDLLHFIPLLQEHCQITYEMAGSFAHCDSPHDNAHPFRDSQSLHYPSESGALLWILDLTRDPELVGQRSQDEVATWKGDISCYPGSLVSIGPLDTWMTSSEPTG